MKKKFLGATLTACVMLSGAALPASAVIPTEPANAVFREEVACDAPLSFSAYYATTDGAVLSELTAFDADVNTALTAYCGGITTESSTGIPCQIFKVDTTGITSDAVVLTLAASTIEHERLALKAYNITTNTWDTLDTAVTEGRLGAKIAVANYADENGIIQAMATPDYIANGSNRLIWSTDQQHYTKHADLNYIYSEIHEYMVEEYQNGNTAYVINTGDIVDNIPYMAGCEEQWQIADEAFTILDDANVPYGIVTGNHDVNDYPINCYDFYLDHFPAERYEDKPWYGGTPDDNKCHYDLVTAGNIDFVIMYLGYGVESDADVIDWANDVIAMYPHRSVILCTHQYLRPTTMLLQGRGEEIYEYIVEPNDNVVMVLSGHYDGAAYKTVELDNGRLVQQVIADYQFVQAESEEYYADHEDPLHHIGDVKHCNGEGYIREVIFNGDTVSMYAFSPVTGGETPFGLRDNITLTLTHPETQRQITTYQFAAVVPNPNNGEDVLEKFMLDDGSNAFAYTSKNESDLSSTVVTETQGLQALIDDAKAIDQTLYTTDSIATLNSALSTAETALAGSNDDVTAAYQQLQNAIGSLKEVKDVILPEQLTMVHDFELIDTAWKNGSGIASLSSPYSEILFTPTDNGGFTAQAASGSGWPQIKYIAPITFTPQDGRVFLYLDLEAGSTWSFYPSVTQGTNVCSGRFNYVIEGSYDPLFDAGSGPYKGVFEITQALEDLGLDLSQEMTMSININVVPGPLTINDMAILTGTPQPIETLNPDGTIGGADTNNAHNGTEKDSGVNMLLIIAIVAVAVIVIGVVVFAIVYKPKKKATTAPSDKTDNQ